MYVRLQYGIHLLKCFQSNPICSSYAFSLLVTNIKIQSVLKPEYQQNGIVHPCHVVFI